MAATNWSNISSFDQILAVPNTGTSGWFWTMMTYMIFVIVVMITINFNLEVALIIGGMAGFFISLLLAYAGLVAWWVVGSFIGIELFIIVYVYVTSGRNV